MILLTWNLARNIKISEKKLYEHMRCVAQNSGVVFKWKLPPNFKGFFYWGRISPDLFYPAVACGMLLTSS